MSRRFKIKWSDLAIADLESIREYVSNDKPVAAERLAERLRQSVLRLAEQPQSGRPLPEFPGTAIREVIVAPYRIVYEPQDDRIVILRVWHGRRQIS
jgi:toxin ParE1/3/4